MVVSSIMLMVASECLSVLFLHLLEENDFCSLWAFVDSNLYLLCFHLLGLSLQQQREIN